MKNKCGGKGPPIKGCLCKFCEDHKTTAVVEPLAGCSCWLCQQLVKLGEDK